MRLLGKVELTATTAPRSDRALPRSRLLHKVQQLVQPRFRPHPTAAIRSSRQLLPASDCATAHHQSLACFGYLPIYRSLTASRIAFGGGNFGISLSLSLEVCLSSPDTSRGKTPAVRLRGAINAKFTLFFGVVPIACHFLAACSIRLGPHAAATLIVVYSLAELLRGC